MAKQVQHSLSVPSGPIQPKYEDFVFNEDFREMAMVGGFNCLGSATRIFDAELGRYVPVAELYASRRAPVVLARDDDGDVLPIRASVPFAKGCGGIYRVTLSSGVSFEATLDHAVLTASGYRTLRRVLADPTGARMLRVVERGLLPSSWVESRPESRRDALRYWGRAAGSPGSYSEGRRLYDARLRLGLGGDRAPSPSRVGAPERGSDGPLGVLGRRPLRSPSLPPLPLASCGASSRFALPVGGLGFPASSCTSVGPSRSPRWGVGPLSLGWSGVERRVGGWLSRKGRTGYASACVEDTISSVELLRHDLYFDLSVPGLHNYLAEGVYHHNTGKSSALADYLIISGLLYPGANLLLARAKLSDLRRTTLAKYLSRAGVLVEDSNKNDGVYYFPEVNGLRSRLYVLGLDRVDLVEVLKSFEPFRAAFEEANEIPEEAFDLTLGRLRQKVRHANVTNRSHIAMLAARWGVPFERAQGLLRIPDKELDLGHFGQVQLKYVFNPEGNEPVWKRVVGVPYPEKMTREWVRENVGIREFQVPFAKMGSYEYKAGNLVALPDGSRAFVAREVKVAPQKDPVTGKRLTLKPGDTPVELMDGRKVAKKHLAFVGQRAAIFAWIDENLSRNMDADENFLYMQDPDLRALYFEAQVDVKKGLLFPEFDRAIHVVPKPRKDIPRSSRVIVGIDQGYRHPTTAVVAVETSYPQGGLLVFREYLVQGLSAFDNATAIRQMVPSYVSNVEYWGDPAMWRTDATSLRSVADDYYEAGVPLNRAANNHDLTINAVKTMLTPLDDYRTGEAEPRIFITEDCVQLIHALETAHYRDLTTGREKWIVDMVDCFRYLVSGTYTRMSVDTASFEVRAPVRTFGY